MQQESECEIAKPPSIGKGLLMTPKTAGLSYLTNKHKRAGSTGTTGDESYTTDDEDCDEIDEGECSIKEHVTKKLYQNHDYTDFGSFSDIATITDKVTCSGSMQRNSSDSSVYSDLGLDKCVDELSTYEDQYPCLNGQTCASECENHVDWGRSVEAKEQALARLQKDLREAHQELKLKDEEVTRLSRIRKDVEAELEELTASLFQEAHNMVRQANEKQQTAEKSLKESQMKVDVLTAEVAALKTLVLTSTPSKPNLHLHPHLDLKSKEDSCLTPSKTHRRSPSHFNLKYGRENSPPESPVKEVGPPISLGYEGLSKDELEVDPVVHGKFLTWKHKPTLDKKDPFVQHIYAEDIEQCLKFPNAKLSEKVKAAVENGTIFVEAVSEKNKAMFPKKCSLLEVPRLCFYRINIGEENIWYNISQICRNRIIAVCDLLNYLRYIERGLVKSSVPEIYWEIIRLRKSIALARLGLNLQS
ncbi:guanine nucleotide exchange factor for Rab-3A [Agrilus planipennis]|uniref:Guanine nucleotide exchange factor for Rab-3A n=1 Tax=Agrilus planipennis TaxID=224129 RepID=A0A1W4WR61_AGRPL|nr:guanine nucleotide exchange factor for Rab-3A [Agrilus planipennis]